MERHRQQDLTTRAPEAEDAIAIEDEAGVGSRSSRRTLGQDLVKPSGSSPGTRIRWYRSDDCPLTAEQLVDELRLKPVVEAVPGIRESLERRDQLRRVEIVAG